MSRSIMGVRRCTKICAIPIRIARIGISISELEQRIRFNANADVRLGHVDDELVEDDEVRNVAPNGEESTRDGATRSASRP